MKIYVVFAYDGVWRMAGRLKLYSPIPPAVARPPSFVSGESAIELARNYMSNGSGSELNRFFEPRGAENGDCKGW